MSDQQQSAQSQGMTLGDIYFILFRRKWIILSCTAAGIFAAAAIFVLKPARYRSEAKLFIRYVAEGKSLSVPGRPDVTRSLNEQETSILNTEGQILQSSDVAGQVVDAVGAQRILAKINGGSSRDEAAGLVRNNLEIELSPSSGSVISLTYQNPDPAVARDVLGQVIVAYIKKHKEMHQSVGFFGDFLVQETERLRKELASTEQQLRDAKAEAGITSVDEAKKDYAELISKIREELFSAQADLARHEAALQDFPKPASAASSTTNTDTNLPPDRVIQYRQICGRLDAFSRREQDLLTSFTEDSVLVKENREQLQRVQKQKRDLEEQYPALARLTIDTTVLNSSSGGISASYASEVVQVRGLKATIEVLNSQLAQVQAQSTKLDELEPRIVDLQRKRDLEEADLRYFTSSQEQARIEEAEGSGKAPNIAVLQSPSPPAKAWSKPFKKKVQMVAAGGLFAGIGLAFLIELFLDQTVKRPVDVTKKLRLPLLVSIPDYHRSQNHRWSRKASGSAAKQNGNGDHVPSSGTQAVMMPVAMWDANHPLRRFYEGLRDRLIVYFEVHGVIHKPKLVAVTSCGQGAGVSSIAAGLAAALSQTGEGNVLLVDMNSERGASQQFRNGAPLPGLEEALESKTRQSALVKSSLHAVNEGMDKEQATQLVPGEFAHLLPKLKASDYDYIIFDLPPVSQTSVTPRVARLLDFVLFTVESEKTSQEVAKHALALLAESKVNVGAVLNKSRRYVPTRLHRDFLSEA